ncbi:trypsin I-P1-like isoform X2 [Sabethes cyaneus]|uniref:trypsin I-P1-like isoform X2 n=1 Tax=Sabethes cyaneus TaxID=53552 RepID=UPI00237E9BEE|nr:trypsin I-P1-like isoform X2 [Sabethes cyaneus]
MWYLLGTIWILIAVCQAHQLSAPYQVSIRSNAFSTTSDIHICNGVIIKAEYILTTANCIWIQDKQTNISRFIHPNETVIYAGYISLGQSSLGNHESIRRNVVSRIPHSKFNLTTLENDIALLKLDRPLPLQNSTAVQWIQLQQQQKSSFAAGNNVNENCFTNIYNNSVGAMNSTFRPGFTLVNNVSLVDEKFCAERRMSSSTRNESCWEYRFSDNRMCDFCAERRMSSSTRNESCWEYRFSDNRMCDLDPVALKQSGDRGTAIVCNFKLAAILAEINPPANPQSCKQIKYTTAYYTPVGSYRDWIENEIGSLYSVGLSGATGGISPATGASSVPNNANPLQPIDSNRAPASSWGDTQVAVTPPIKPPGKPSSASAASISATGIVSKLIPFNLFIPFAFIYGFHRC